MASSKITSAGVLALAVIFPATIAQSSDPVPDCLNQCLAQTTHPCTTASLPLLIFCINTQCLSPSDSSTTANTAASSLALTYTPKLQYSCQQSFLPGSAEDAPSMQLTGDGKCMTSPYDFQSLFVSAAADEGSGEGGGEGEGGMTLQKMSTQCTMSLFAGEQCEGEQTKLDLSGVEGDKCVFQSGRSARLVCSALMAQNTPSYASILSSLCTGSNAPAGLSGPSGTGGSGRPNGTSPAANSTSPNSPYGTANATSSLADPKIPTVTSQPYIGRASGDQVAKPSLIALVALFAVAVLVL